jgi:hypothetical protein
MTQRVTAADPKQLSKLADDPYEGEPSKTKVTESLCTRKQYLYVQSVPGLCRVFSETALHGG